MPKPALTPGAASTSSLDQLNEALSLAKKSNAILDAVLAGWSVPDAPEQPPFIDALNQIKAQANHSIAVADKLLATMAR